MKKSIRLTFRITCISMATILLLAVIFFGHTDIPVEELKPKYAVEPSQFVEALGMNVHYRDEGNPSDTLPIVLIHGTGSSLHTFDGWATQLKRNNRVIRMDLPAYGLTGPFPDRDYSISNYVKFVEQFLSALGIQKCIMAGNSLGGNITWRFAIANPNMVDKMILIDASGYASRAKSRPLAFGMAEVPVVKNLFTYITPRFVVKSSVENVYFDKTKVDEALVDRYFELSLREGNRQAFIDRFAVEKDTSAYHQIKTIRQPTLVLWGKADNLIPVKMAYKFHEDLPNSTLVVLENVGHVPMEEVPERSLKPVRIFLKH